MKLKDFIRGRYKIVNGVVNVYGNVNINETDLTEIPWKFGCVTGWFDCSYNKLISLKNCPTSVGGNIYCQNNPIESFKGVPFDVLMKIDNLYSNFSHLVKSITIPNECFNEIRTLLKKNDNKVMSKKVSVEERLSNI